MNRKIHFFPAWDKTHPDPKKNYGVSCLELRFVVEGEGGAVEFQLLTQWYQKSVMDRRYAHLKKDIYSGKEDYLVRHLLEPYPMDFCYFSPTRKSEDDIFFSDGVSYVLGGKPCYYGYKYTDEDGRVAHDVAYWILVEHGDEALWKYLEEYYVDVFGEDSGHQQVEQ